MKRNNKEDKKTARLLDNIHDPSDLRKLSVDDLPALCEEIRAFLIDSLSRHPGHFASSMGAVELTVALHYVFDTPYDRIVWDVGHQSYAHKVLTGRKDLFSTLRQEGGLSGFPNPDESEYDTFTAGHASNSISAALGMATATLVQNENPRRNVVAVIGDASISGGLAFEGLNNAANMRNNLLIVLNDNDMSIDRNVGSLNSYLAHLTASKSYNTFRYKTYRFLKKLRLISEKRRGTILRFNNSLKSLLGREQNIFEGLNIRYFGPFNGHDVKRIVRVLTDIKDMEGPRLLHLRTTKGKGFAPAEKNPTVWHAPGRFNPATGECEAESDKSKKDKYQDAFGVTLAELAADNPKIVGITAAMPTGTSISVVQSRFPDRVFDVGISEGHAVTFAAGLARDGMIPVVAIYSSFLQRGYDHIIHDVAIQKAHVVFCIDRAGIVGEDGATHHGLFDLVYLRSVPGMIVAAPSSGEQLRNLLYTATVCSTVPFAIRYPRGAVNLGEWRDVPMRELPVGKGRKLSSRGEIAVLSVGPILEAVNAAVEIVATKGINVAQYDMIYVKPLDDEILDELRRLRVPVVTVEDGTVVGGFGSAVTEALAADNIPVYRLGVDDRFPSHATPAQLYRQCGLDADSIAKFIINIVDQSRQ